MLFISARSLQMRGQYNQAIEQFRKILEMDSNYPVARLQISEVLLTTGEQAAGIEEASQYMADIGHPDVVAGIRKAYTSSGYAAALRYRISTQDDAGNLEFYYPWGGWPRFAFRGHHHKIGCPMLRDFRSMGTLAACIMRFS